jgi:hypothetical protein
MKKNVVVIGTILTCLLSLSGCTKRPLPELPNDAVAFEMGTFIDDKHDGDSFGTIEYNGRTYIAYGTINDKYKQSCIESCIGYIIQDEHSSSVVDLNNTGRRIYSLSGDSEHNFLMDYDDSVKLMNQPGFFRAIDTNGKDIDIPDYIDPLGYEIWGEQ